MHLQYRRNPKVKMTVRKKIASKSRKKIIIMLSVKNRRKKIVMRMRRTKRKEIRRETRVSETLSRS